MLVSLDVLNARIKYFRLRELPPTMTSSAINLHRSQALPDRAPYLVNAAYDLLFVCGGLALILSAACLHRFGLDTNQAQQSTPLMALGIVGTYLLAGPHTGATIYRLYGERENRRRFILVAYVLPALLATLFVAGLFAPVVAQMEAVLYLLLVWHHYMAQSYGVAMMYCARAGMKLSGKDKRSTKAVLYLAVAVAVAQQFTAGWQRQSFLHIPLPHMAFLPEPLLMGLQVLLLLSILVFLAQQLIWASTANRQSMPLPAIFTLLVTAAFLTLGRNLSDIVWLFVPNFFHATQYLSVVFAFDLRGNGAKDQTDNAPEPFELLSSRYVRYFLLSLALFSGLPFTLSAMGFPLNLCTALAFFALSLHHFAADACIWKLKDKSVHSRLVS
ncbi:MAG: hypothetical protein JSS86_09270 [Cyanobacteria bacterium SZAS LIN-2]|nr:hypothetical protein [Cyanobacteria bacterium SZAS LIN-3]MBS1996488.1 hypothetical protein [Cyanobacteria bacterium SZAS LIN-2]